MLSTMHRSMREDPVTRSRFLGYKVTGRRARALGMNILPRSFASLLAGKGSLEGYRDRHLELDPSRLPMRCVEIPYLS